MGTVQKILHPLVHPSRSLATGGPIFSFPSTPNHLIDGPENIWFSSLWAWVNGVATWVFVNVVLELRA